MWLDRLEHSGRAGPLIGTRDVGPCPGGDRRSQLPHFPVAASIQKRHVAVGIDGHRMLVFGCRPERCERQSPGVPGQLDDVREEPPEDDDPVACHVVSHAVAVPNSLEIGGCDLAPRSTGKAPGVSVRKPCEVESAKHDHPLVHAVVGELRPAPGTRTPGRRDIRPRDTVSALPGVVEVHGGAGWVAVLGRPIPPNTVILCLTLS